MSGVRCTPSVVARHLRNSYAEYAWWSGCRDLNPGPLDLHVSGTLRCAERRSTWWTVSGNREVKKSSNRPVDGLKLRPGRPAAPVSRSGVDSGLPEGVQIVVRIGHEYHPVADCGRGARGCVERGLG